MGFDLENAVDYEQEKEDTSEDKGSKIHGKMKDIRKHTGWVSQEASVCMSATMPGLPVWRSSSQMRGSKCEDSNQRLK